MGFFSMIRKGNRKGNQKQNICSFFDGIQEIVFFFYCIKPTKNNVFQCYFDIYLGFLCLFLCKNIKAKKLDEFFGDLYEDMKEMAHDMSNEEKTVWKQRVAKLNQLVQ